MTVREIAEMVMCPRCGAVPCEQCLIVDQVGKTRSGTHYARWAFAAELNHDPGDEDRNER